jgi:hypothetical protein
MGLEERAARVATAQGVEVVAPEVLPQMVGVEVVV